MDQRDSIDDDLSGFDPASVPPPVQSGDPDPEVALNAINAEADKGVGGTVDDVEQLLERPSD